VALDDAAGGDLDLDPRLLDRIGVIQRDIGKFLRELADLRARPFGAVEPLGGGADLVLREGHGATRKEVRRDA